MFKNVASQKIIFTAYDSTGVLKTGDAANLTAYRSLDGGAVTVLADTSATELDATNAKGCYIFDLAQGETNADMALYTCKSSTSGVQLDPVLIFTTAPASNTSVAQTGDSYARIGANGAGLTDLASAAALALAKAILDKLDTAMVLDGAVYQFTANALELAPSGGATPQQITEYFMDVDMSTLPDTGSNTRRTPLQAFRGIRNRFETPGGVLEVYKENDSTVDWTAALTTTAGMDPITGMDPTGP